MGQPGTARLFAAMSPWFLHSEQMATHNPALPVRMVRRSSRRGGEKGTDIQNSFAPGPSVSSSWPVKLEGAGPQNVVTSSVTCCGFAPRELPLRSARLAGPAGSAGGGHCWAARSRTQSLPPCSAMCGAAPARHGRQMARRWAKCSGWLTLRSQAGSHSDPKGMRRTWGEHTAVKKAR